MRAVGWLGLSCFSLQFVKTKGSSPSPSRDGMSFSQSAAPYLPAIAPRHPPAFQWKRLQLLMLAPMLLPTPAPLPSVGRRPVRIQSDATTHTAPHIYTIADVSAEVASTSRNPSTSSGRSTRSSGHRMQV